METVLHRTLGGVGPLRVCAADRLPAEAKHIREEVFVREQGFSDEFDDIDEKAVHRPARPGACRRFLRALRLCALRGSLRRGGLPAYPDAENSVLKNTPKGAAAKTAEQTPGRRLRLLPPAAKQKPSLFPCFPSGFSEKITGKPRGESGVPSMSVSRISSKPLLSGK